MLGVSLGRVGSIGSTCSKGGGGLPNPPSGFALLMGRDGQYLRGADGAYLYGRAA